MEKSWAPYFLRKPEEERAWSGKNAKEGILGVELRDENLRNISNKPWENNKSSHWNIAIFSQKTWGKKLDHKSEKWNLPIKETLSVTFWHENLRSYIKTSHSPRKTLLRFDTQSTFDYDFVVLFAPPTKVNHVVFTLLLVSQRLRWNMADL